MTSSDHGTEDAPVKDAIEQKYAEERAKRVGDPTRGRSKELTGELRHYLDDPHTSFVAREPVTGEELDVVVLGAGLGGLLACARLHEAGVRSFRLLDQAGDVGGVWYWNRYPGARCDVESYVYMPLLEEVGYIPTEKYATGTEIFEHAQRIAKHYDIYSSALLQTTVQGMVWQESRARWEVTTDRGDMLYPRFVIICDGGFSKLKLPLIPGIESFAGHSFHTSRWDYKYTGGGPEDPLTGLHDKTVAIIGTGATAVQITAPVGRAAKQTYVFQRTPSSVGARDNRPTEPGFLADMPPGWQAERMRNFATIVTGGAQEQDLVDDGWTRYFFELSQRPDLRGLPPDERKQAVEEANFEQMERLRRRVDELVADPDVAESLKPYYAYFCTRPCFHDEYLQAFNNPSVSLVDTDGRGIERFTESGLVVDGVEYPVDCVIFATGFEYGVPFERKTGFDVVGVDGVRLSERWKDGPSTLYGLTSRGFPNLFFSPGSNAQATVLLNFVHFLTEYAGHYAYVIDEMLQQGEQSYFDTDAAAEEEWVETIMSHARDNLAFSQRCTPNRWNNEGSPDEQSLRRGNFPGTPLQFFDLLSDWRRAGRLDGLEIINSGGASAGR